MKKILFILLLFASLLHAEIDVIDAPSTGNGARTFTSVTDGLVVAIFSYEVAGISDISSVTFGGNNLSYVIRAREGSTIYNYVECWIMLEADIPPGSSTFIVAYTGSTPPDVGYACFLLDSVDQVSPVSDTDSDYSASAQILAAIVSTVAGGYCVFSNSQQNSGTATWTGASEIFDQVPGGEFNHSGAGDPHAAPGLVVGEVTVTGVAGRMAIVGVELAPSASGSLPDNYKRRKIIINP